MPSWLFFRATWSGKIVPIILPANDSLIVDPEKRLPSINIQGSSRTNARVLSLPVVTANPIDANIIWLPP
jgi:hypothetical protein